MLKRALRKSGLKPQKSKARLNIANQNYMQIKLYTIPVFDSEAIEEELNRFLRGHRILQLERHFCADNGGYWAIMIEYVDGDPVAEAPDERAMLF